MASITDHGAVSGSDATAAVQEAVHFVEQTFPLTFRAAVAADGDVALIGPGRYSFRLPDDKLGNEIKRLLELPELVGRPLRIRRTADNWLLGNVASVVFAERVATLVLSPGYVQHGPAFAAGQAVTLMVDDVTGGVVYFPEGEWRVTATVRCLRGTAMLGTGYSSLFDFSGAPAGDLALEYEGDVDPVEVRLSTDAIKGESYIHVGAGDLPKMTPELLFKLYSDTQWESHDGDKAIGEMNAVRSVSGSEVRVRDLLRDTYTTAASGRLVRILRPVRGAVITNLRFRAGTSAASLHNLARTSWCLESTLKNCYVEYFRGSVATYVDFLDLAVKTVRVEHCDGPGQGTVFALAGAGADFNMDGVVVRDAGTVLHINSDRSNAGRITDGFVSNFFLKGHVDRGLLGLADEDDQISIGPYVEPLIPTDVGAEIRWLANDLTSTGSLDTDTQMAIEIGQTADPARLVEVWSFFAIIAWSAPASRSMRLDFRFLQAQGDVAAGTLWSATARRVVYPGQLIGSASRYAAGEVRGPVAIHGPASFTDTDFITTMEGTFNILRGGVTSFRLTHLAAGVGVISIKAGSVLVGRRLR